MNGSLLNVLLGLLLSTCANAFPEIGHWDVRTSPETVLFFAKSVYEGTSTKMSVTTSKESSLKLIRTVFFSNCAEAFAEVNQSSLDTQFTTHIPLDLITSQSSEFELLISDNTNVLEFTSDKKGIQMVALNIKCAPLGSCEGVSVRVVTDVSGNYGYLSPIEYPLRTVYGLLAFAYLLLSFVWLGFTFCHWKYLLRIQYYITLVIFIGLCEQITQFALYNTLNNTGVPIKSALVFGIVVSCVKRTLSRFLLLIACVGYGITKSRLGTAYRRIVWVCLAFLVCSLFDSGLRVFRPRFRQSAGVLAAGLPLVLLNLVIFWWSFSYLVATLRETRMRRNAVKHKLYKTFSAIIICAALVSVVCMAVSIFELHWKPCTRAWGYIWFDETFWQLLFYVVLFGIVVLWRPSRTNKLYARSAFLDSDVEPPPEDLEELLIDAVVSGFKDDSPKVAHTVSEDDALRWAEENIPPSAQGSQPDNNEDNRTARPPMKID